MWTRLSVCYVLAFWIGLSADMVVHKGYQVGGWMGFMIGASLIVIGTVDVVKKI